MLNINAIKFDVKAIRLNTKAIKEYLWSFVPPNPESEFLPAALELVETPPSPACRAIAGTIILFFAIAFLWACFGSVDIIAISQGRIVPSGRTKHARDGRHG
jgi:hypothetical protein